MALLADFSLSHFFCKRGGIARCSELGVWFWFGNYVRHHDLTGKESSYHHHCLVVGKTVWALYFDMLAC